MVPGVCHTTVGRARKCIRQISLTHLSLLRSSDDALCPHNQTLQALTFRYTRSRHRNHIYHQVAVGCGNCTPSPHRSGNSVRSTNSTPAKSLLDARNSTGTSHYAIPTTPTWTSERSGSRRRSTAGISGCTLCVDRDETRVDIGGETHPVTLDVVRGEEEVLAVVVRDFVLLHYHGEGTLITFRRFEIFEPTEEVDAGLERTGRVMSGGK